MEITRPSELQIGMKRLTLPVYFPSISSVKTALRPLDYLQVLSSLTALNSQYLVSAFDLSTIEAPEQAVRILATSTAEGAITLMDSGNYESFWKNAQANWLQADFHRMLRAFPCDLAFGFDEQEPPVDLGDHATLLVSRWEADQDVAGACQIIPIIHASANQLPLLCATVVNETGVSMLAVPERKLGNGIIERARAVQAIRAELDKQERYVALHLLGTGNPISIAVYSAMGADSFDGLEWCQTVVDHDTGLLYHLTQSDFFRGQTTWGDTGLSFHARTLAHNLEFFSGWIKRLRYAINEGRVVDFCRHNLPVRVFHQCAQSFGWVL
jgi:hypothetical protein